MEEVRPEQSSARTSAGQGNSERLTGDEVAVWLEVVDGGWALMAQVAAGFSARGLSVSDLRLLEVLGTRREFGISELAAAVHIGVSTLSRQIARLIESGDVVRVRSDTDGRHRLVRMTEAGRQNLDRHLELRDELVRTYVVDSLTPEEYRALGAAFAKIAAVCDPASQARRR